MQLSRINSSINREERNKINDNYDKIEREYNSIKYSFDSIIAESGDSNPEIVAARGQYVSLRQRLENLTTKEEAQAIASGAPRGVYPTLLDLTNAFPQGNNNIYIVETSGGWYFWNGNSWTLGGIYQASGVSDRSVGIREVDSVILNKLMISEYDFSSLSNWEFGNLNINTGASVTGANQGRFRNTQPFYIMSGSRIQLTNTDYSFAVFKYNMDGSFIGYDAYTNEYNVTQNLLARLLVKRVDNANFTESELQALVNVISSNGAYKAYGEGGVFETLETIPTIQNTQYITYDPNTSSVNLLDTTAVTQDGYYDPTTLAFVNNTEFVQTAFIPCKTGDLIRLSASSLANNIVFKNEQGVIYLGGSIPFGASRQRTVPAGAVSFSIAIRKTALSTFMITLNRNIPATYTPFGNVTINDERLLESLKDRNQRFKNANFLGDSITYGYSPYDGSQLSVRWVELVKEKLGLNVARNYGISGSTLGSNANGTRNPMVDRYVDMNDLADLVCVFGGTNDWNFDVPLGTIDDTTKFTYYGALKILMNGLYTKYPNSTIVFFTPLHRMNDTNGANGNLKDYRDAVIKVGELFGIAVLDLFATSGFYPENETNYNTLIPDGRHPNEDGHRKLADRIAGFLKTL